MADNIESDRSGVIPFHQHVQNLLDGDLTQDEKLQLFEIQKTISSPGWKHISDMMELQRESIIKSMENTQEVGGENGWRSLQGILKGFRLAVQIPSRLYARAVELAQVEEDRTNEMNLQSAEAQENA